MYEQLDLFTYNKKRSGLYDPLNYSRGYEYMAFQTNDTPRIQAMKYYQEYILQQMQEAKSEEVKAQWLNALKSIERQIEDFLC